MASVSIHAPAWGATQRKCSCSRIWCVSIHAPAWGATYACYFVCYGFFVSIHAPAWGATSAITGKDDPNIMFQSTRPHGARRGLCLRKTSKTVSIHAPAWGATDLPISLDNVCPSFNPRARMGRDLNEKERTDARMSFNPRARMGRDRKSCLQS